MNEIRAMLIDSATRLFSEQVDAKILDAAKEDGWSAKLWEIVEEAQLPYVSVAEETGGAGGSLSDLAAVVRIAGRHAAPVPLAETALAAWLLSESNLKIPAGPLTLAPLHGEKITARKNGAQWTLSGTAKRVPFARIAGHLVVLAASSEGDIVACIDASKCKVTPGRNLAFEPRDDVVFDNVEAVAAAKAGTAISLAAIRERGALMRSLQMAGALERALELAARYAGERVQFGRKIGQFQAIQQELARCAGEVAAAVAAALSAAGAVERNQNAAFAVASAKIRTAQAAQEGAMIAHQVHGAIGVTDEYALHHATLRLFSWREEFGNEAAWSIELGRVLCGAGADKLWPTLTAD